jgi:hypothetical protein
MRSVYSTSLLVALVMKQKMNAETRIAFAFYLDHDHYFAVTRRTEFLVRQTQRPSVKLMDCRS